MTYSRIAKSWPRGEHMVQSKTTTDYGVRRGAPQCLALGGLT